MSGAEDQLKDGTVFRAAVEFLKKKSPLTAETYQAVSDAARARAFTVSGYSSLTVLQQFLDELTDACENGTTKAAFTEQMNDFLARNGYEGLNPFHADVIFRTNMQTAYSAGHYKSMADPAVKKLRPYWKYVTAGDGNVRETHAAMEGRIYAADDPIWDVWYPPNGFRCRCSVVSLTKKQVERSGTPVSTSPPRDVDTGTGEIITRYPDKGFSNNPAKDAWKPDLTGVDENLKNAFKERIKPS
jgi:SPP1 gp7 family putative phage head morphogenesis protein